MVVRSSSRSVRRPAQHEESSDAYSEDGASESDDGVPKSAESAVKWVACDACSQWRRLSGLTDLKTLPKRWFCKFNPDPRFNDCSIPEEDEEDPEQRLRSHLLLWVRRLRSAEDAETRLPMAHGTRAARRNRPVGEQEWIQCCDSNCGKWRALHRSLDASTVTVNNEFFCVMNTWDEALASCAAPQEIPSEAARERAVMLDHQNGDDDFRAKKASTSDNVEVMAEMNTMGVALPQPSNVIVGHRVIFSNIDS